MGERHAAAVPRDLQEARRRQIGRDDDRPGRDRDGVGAAELAQHAIAHIAQIGSAGTEIQVVGFVILAYLQIHRISPRLLRGGTRFEGRERGLGHDRIGEHRDLEGQYRLRFRVAGLHQRNELSACGRNGGVHPARFLVHAAPLARRERTFIGEHDQPAAREPGRDRRSAQADDGRRITLHCRRR